MDAEIRALINEIRTLTGIMAKSAGITTGSASIIDPTFKSSQGLANAQGIPFDKLTEQVKENTSATKDQTKQTRRQTDATVEHIKKLEQFGGIMKSVGDLVGMAVKYNITRPYELMGGQAGVIARGALEREKDFGKTITSSVAAALFAFNPLAGAAVAGFGAMGGNQIIGRVFGQGASIEASARQNVAQITQAGILPYMEQQLLSFGASRMNVGSRGMGGAGFGSFQRSMAELGIQGPQAVELYGQAMSIGGQRGISRLNDNAVQLAARAGIYGGPEQVLMGTLLGGRAGFGQGSIEAASRRSGMTMDTVGQAALATRMQTFLAGGASGNRLFEMASRTDLARTGGITAAVGAITSAASGMAGAAEGNEASEMMLFQQFRAANPGSSYMDFVEARRNGVNDPRWLKTVRGAANSFAGQGQFGRIMGQALGVSATPMGVSGTAAMMNEAFTGRLGDASKVGELANLAPGAIATINQSFTTNMSQAISFEKAYGEQLVSTNTALEKVVALHKDWIPLMEQTAVIMNRMSVSTLGVMAEPTMNRGFENGDVGG